MQLKNFSLTFRGIYVLSYCFLKKKKKSNIPQVSSNQGTLTCQISPSNYITTNNQGRGRGRKKKERKKWNKKKGKRSVLKYKFSREQRREITRRIIAANSDGSPPPLLETPSETRRRRRRRFVYITVGRLSKADLKVHSANFVLSSARIPRGDYERCRNDTEARF